MVDGIGMPVRMALVEEWVCESPGGGGCIVERRVSVMCMRM